MWFRRNFKWLILLETIILLLVAWIYVATRQVKTATYPAYADTAEWLPVDSRTLTSASFIIRADFVNAAGATDLFRFRLIGETCTFDLIGNDRQLSLWQNQSSTERISKDSYAHWQSFQAGDELLLAKAPDSVEVYLNGQRVLYAGAPLENWRAYRLEVAGANPLTTARFQRIEPLIFADDFMHAEGELGQWQIQSGTWAVHALQNPVRSANPFSLFGQGATEPAQIAVGYWFWRNYEFSCAALPLSGSDFGLSFCTSPDGESGYDLRWRENAGRQVLSLAKRTADGELILAAKEVAFQPESWLRLRIIQLHGLIEVYVDEQQLLRTADPHPFPGGLVALWTEGGDGTIFDDVAVLPASELNWHFSGHKNLPRIFQSSVSTDASYDQSDYHGLPLHLNDRILLQGILRKNIMISADFIRSQAEQMNLVMTARDRGNGNSLQLRLAKKDDISVLELIQHHNHAEQVLQRAAVAALPERFTLSLMLLENRAWAAVNGEIKCFTTDVTHLQGGHCTIEILAGNMQLQKLHLQPQNRMPQIENRIETFEHEQSMQNWSSASSEWRRAGKAYWHQSDFWRDFAVTADVNHLSGSSGNWGVLIGAEVAAQVEAVAELQYSVEEKQLRFTLNNQVLHELPTLQAPQKLELQKLDTFLIAGMDDKVLWVEPLPPTLSGLCRIGRSGSGSEEEWAQAMQIRADGVKTYAFQHAPADWLPVSGTWEVTSRWECDPRWSFFSGYQRHGPAMVWNKLQHGEDFSMEFFVGPKMERDRGKKYEYAGDFNAVICADGRNINSGYSFMFGGWDDSGTYIVRQNAIVSENKAVVVPRDTSIHRRWFHVKLRKQDSRLTLWVDGEKAVETEDAQPLPGNRFGLWTYDNGMMVSQVRISSNRPWTIASRTELLHQQTPKTPYDKDKN